MQDENHRLTMDNHFQKKTLQRWRELVNTDV